MKDDIPKALRIPMATGKICCGECLSPFLKQSAQLLLPHLCVGSKEVSGKVEWTAVDQGGKETTWDRTFSVSLVQFGLS